MARVDYDRMAADYVEERVLPPEGWSRGGPRSRPGCRRRARAVAVLDLGAGTGQFAAAIAGWFGSRWSPWSRRADAGQAARAHPYPSVRWVAGGPSGCRWATGRALGLGVHRGAPSRRPGGRRRRAAPGAAPGRPGAGRRGRRADGCDHAVRAVLPRRRPGLVVVGDCRASSGCRRLRRRRVRTEALQRVDQVSATSLAAYRDKVRLRPTPAWPCCPTKSSTPGWPPSTRPSRPRPSGPGGGPARPAGPCGSGQLARRWAEPSAPVPGPRRPGHG